MTEAPKTPRRKTWQQAAVRDALENASGFVSAQQLFSELREQGSAIGLATVYRALSGLVETNDADSLLSPNGETLFAACEIEGHHHHLICRECGRSEEINAQVVEDWSQKVAADHGFIDASHEIDIFGVCSDCQE